MCLSAVVYDAGVPLGSAVYMIVQVGIYQVLAADRFSLAVSLVICL
jgi:hypothetical protein